MNEQQRNGMGGNASESGGRAQAAEAEVLPPYCPPGADQIHVGRVSFDQTTLIKSPCFWLLVGIGVGVAICYGVSRQTR